MRAFCFVESDAKSVVSFCFCMIFMFGCKNINYLQYYAIITSVFLFVFNHSKLLIK